MRTWDPAHLRPLLCLLLLIGTLAIALVPADGWAASNEEEEEENHTGTPLYYRVGSLNEGLPQLDKEPDLETPRAALINLLQASRRGDFERAARSLNFADIPKENRDPARLAKELNYVLTQQVQINYRNIPDRPNGALEEVPSSSDDSTPHPLLGKPRRSIKLDEVPLTLGDAEIRLERFKPDNGEPVWLFSPRTVGKIEAMYALHGPGPLFELLPWSVKQGLLRDSTRWQWLILFGVASLSALIGWMVKALLCLPLGRIAPKLGREETLRLAHPLGFVTATLTFYVVTYVLLSAPGNIVRSLYVLVTMSIVITVTWVGVRLIDVFSALVARKYRDRMGPFEGEDARLRYTRITVGRYVLIFLAICVGLGLALYELQVIKNLSLSFLASAGVASVILGATAHSVLGNTLAAIQIAMTRPVAINDSVLFEGHWGFIEDITYAYVAIRTWDDRRVIVPLSYFLSHPFENWSKASARIIKPIYLYADYRVDVDAVRKKFRDLLDQSKLWDRSVEPIFQVTGMSEKTIELRALCSAKNATDAWNLHCEMRESLIRFLQTMEEGRYLPKDRVEVSNRDGEKSDQAPRRPSQPNFPSPER